MKKKVKTLAQQLARSGEKLTVLPAQLSEFFGKANAGQLTVNVKKVVVGCGACRALEAAEPAHLRAAGLLAAVLRGHHVSRPLPRVLGLPWPALVFSPPPSP